MFVKSIVRELKEIKSSMGSLSKRGAQSKKWHCMSKSHIVPDVPITPLEPIQQGQWANLPPELLLDIIRRLEESETSWPARAIIVFCASVCKSWRAVTKVIVKTPEQCGRLTFPVSLKQPGPRDVPIQCFIKRNRETSTYLLYLGLVPSETESDKLLLAARKVKRATGVDFIISLVADDFSRASNAYIGKLRSKYFGTKFTIYDNQQPHEARSQRNGRSSRRFHSKQVPPRVPAYNYSVGTVAYELNVLRARGPRRIHCIMSSIPISSLQEGGTAPTPTFPFNFEGQASPSASLKGKDPILDFSSTSLSEPPAAQDLEEPLVLKNKSPRWHEQLQCWCLNFKGRVTVASVKNFQLVAAVDPSHNISAEEHEKVILQFGKIGKDIFTMDYRYPLSAFQAFGICLSSFDTKPACE